MLEMLYEKTKRELVVEPIVLLYSVDDVKTNAEFHNTESGETILNIYHQRLDFIF